MGPKPSIGRIPLMAILLVLCIHTEIPIVADSYRPVIDPANFTAQIDNPLFPLSPRTSYTYRGMTDQGEELDTVEVTRQTRVVMGVTCVVVHDTAFVNGALAEDTFDYFAQDKQGNVWYFGEDTKEYQNGVVVSTEGSWEAGVDGAQPGIVMEAHPQVGDVYRQEFSKKVALDMAEVLSTAETVTVPFGTFAGCLMTKDFSRLDKKVVEYKWYAPGVGFVKSTTVQGGTDTSELVNVSHR
jgi:hypothetical protein